MERKPVYCECPKSPGSIIEVDGLWPHQRHTVCGMEFDLTPKVVRKPVFCAHIYTFNHGDYTDCEVCHHGWLTSDGPREIVIGYVEDGGRGES